MDKDKRQRYDMFGEDGAEQHNPFDYDSFFNSQGTGHFHFNFDDLFEEFGGDDDFFGGFHGHGMFDDMFGSDDNTFGGMFEQHTTSSRGNHGNCLTPSSYFTLSHRSTLWDSNKKGWEYSYTINNMLLIVQWNDLHRRIIN